jgi:DNA mismatch endonuclease, patch repair protein
LVFPSRRKIIFVHGCFWHLHENCPNNRPPKSRRDFWGAKLRENKKRDRRNLARLLDLGRQALIVWECETHDSPELARRITAFLEDTS